jgi:Flp pilus assembly protein TadG
MSSVSRKLFNQFAADDRGVIAINTAVMLVPLVAFLGAGVDYSMLVRRQQQLQLAADATALSLAKEGFGQEESQMVSRGTSYFKAVAQDSNASLEKVYVQTADNNGFKKLCVKGQTNAPITFLKMFGVENVPISVLACSTTGSASFEVALVLDNSGSMKGTKISSLKVAAKNFVDSMYAAVPTADKARISVIPFAENVRLATQDVQGATWVDRNGQSPEHWRNFASAAPRFTSKFGVFTELTKVNSSYAWLGCFDSLPYPYNTRENPADASPPAALLVPSLAPDDLDSTGGYSYGSGLGRDESLNDYISDQGDCTTTETSTLPAPLRACKYKNPTKTSRQRGDGPNYACGGETLMRLSTDKAALKAKIDALQASGMTDIQQGVWWGWNTLSPVAAWKEGYSYDRRENKKVMIIMTDGDNTWNSADATKKSEYSAFGFFTSLNAAGLHYAQPPQDVNGNSLQPPTSSNSNTNEGRAYAIMNDVTRRTCANVRASGVTIYTIAFSDNNGISEDGKALLQDCAGSSARYFTATSSTINQVFALIAQQIGKLRLSD